MINAKHIGFRKQAGFTLLEILVTVLIISFGLLGLAGLQLVGVKNTQSGYLRSQVAFLAGDIMDRMQANLVGLNNNDYDIAIGTAPAVIDCFGIDKDCDPAQLADFDLVMWKRYLNQYLTNGDGSIVTIVNPNAFTPLTTGVTTTITLQWLDEYQAEAPNQTATFRMSLP